MGILAKGLLATNMDGKPVVLAAHEQEEVVIEQAHYYRSYFTNIAASPSVSDEDSSKLMNVIRSLQIVDVMVTPVEAL